MSSRRLRALGLAMLMAVVAVNVWTGGPLLAIWIGSRVQGSGPPSMVAVVTVGVVLLVVSLALVRLLAWLGQAYDQVTGAPPAVRRQAPWMRSMRGERVPQGQLRLRTLDRVLIACVVVAAIAFEVWFFFFAGSSIG
jgi:hypothetical protein